VGGKAIPIKADVSSPTDVRRMVSRILNAFGTIDILVNNAGVLIPNKFLKIRSEDWDRVLGTNLKGAFLCSQAVAPVMMKRGGRIINIASVSGLALPSGMASVDYVASKAGLIGLTRAMAVHLGPKINVNAVAPGTIETEMTKFLTKNERHTMVEESLSKRLGKPEEIAYACVFLASKEADWITGEVLTVSGGRGMR
jgi:3-oxoacyl-[acyl-carrier protein] reductase